MKERFQRQGKVDAVTLDCATSLALLRAVVHEYRGLLSSKRRPVTKVVHEPSETGFILKLFQRESVAVQVSKSE